MKRLVYSSLAVALATLALASCNKTEVDFQETTTKKTVNFTVAGKVDPTITKTYIEESGDTYLAHWSDVSDEHLGLLFDDIAADMTATTLDAFDITSDIATFAGSAEVTVADHTIHPFYPASAFNKTYGSGKIGLKLIDEQHPFTSTFDPAADVMIGADQDITVDDADNILIEDVVLQRPMAVLRLHLVAKNTEAKAYNETVTSVEMTVAEGKVLSGNFSYTPDNSEISWNVENNKVKAVYGDAYGNADQVLIDTDADFNSVYLVVNPVTLVEGTTITFDIETDVHSGINKISRSVNVPAGGMEFLAGKVNEINLTVRDKDVPDVVADTRILVEGFDGETVNKTQTAATASGVFGTGVSSSLSYTYSTTNTNVRINGNGQTATNPFLYISGEGESLTMENIVVSNQTWLDFSAKVKNAATLTLKYKESSSLTWLIAGTYTGTASFSDASISFTIANTVESLDLQIIGSAALIVDDIVLKPGSAPAHNLSVTPTTVTLGGASGSTKTVTVTSNYTWTAALSGGASGFTISPTTGGNAATITITASANGSTTEETTLGTFTVTDGETTETITVKQSQYEDVVYTLSPKAGTNNSYTGNCDVTVDSITWNIEGNSQGSGTWWRFGGKNLTNQNRALTGKTSINKTISKIEVTHGAASNITVNSYKLIVASDADYNTVVDEVTESFTANGVTTFTPSGGKTWSNCYYKFVYNVTVSGNTNRYVQFTQAEFTGK